MKCILLFIFLTISGISLFSQNNSILKFIFIPHPRSESNVIQSVAPGIEKIDFTQFDVKILGGDLTYYTSDKRSTLEYCDSLFDLGNLNTLWTFGNHDVQSGNRALIKEFTGRDGYYSYYRDGVTFIVLDTEENANSFKSTFIKGTQLQMVKDVCDSITDSRHLIILHHRLMWMINNDYFKDRLTDSIAASSRSMDTTNFYSEIFPLLQKVKNKGIQIKVFGGDKSKINIEYSPEDSITFYAVRLAVDFPDSINNVIVMQYNLQDKTMDCSFVPLDNVSVQDSTVNTNYRFEDQKSLKVWQYSESSDINIQLLSGNNDDTTIQIYSINGQLCRSININSNEIVNVNLGKPGIYIAKALIGKIKIVKKFVLK